MGSSNDSLLDYLVCLHRDNTNAGFARRWDGMIKELRYHPAAEAFPMMENDRYIELLEDIQTNGQREDITICEGMILDGRNRYKACISLGIPYRSRNFTGDPWAYVWSLNGTRRDLEETQRYLIWKHCNENSQSWRDEQQRIKDEANQKRSKAAKEQHEISNPRIGEVMAVEPKVLPPEKENKTRKVKAEKAHVGSKAVQNGDFLEKERPDLADKVRTGKMKPAAAIRETKREKLKVELEAKAAQEIQEPTGKYDVIVIDPPWPMTKIERDERPNQVDFDYPTMTEYELSKLSIPAADDCHLWLWTTQKFLPMALELLNSWEFKYVCVFVWHKPGGMQPVDLPQYNCEFAIYARKGHPKFIDTKAFPVCFNAARTAHSEKPEEFYQVLRRVTAGRRLDMFNRRKIEGFDRWGQEANL